MLMSREYLRDMQEHIKGMDEKDLIQRGTTKEKVLNDEDIMNRLWAIYQKDVQGYECDRVFSLNDAVDEVLGPLPALADTKKDMFKAGDIVFVSDSDKEYEEQMGTRNHDAFFGRVTDVDVYGDEIVVEVTFPRTANGEPVTWSYNAKELSYASELKNLTLEEFSNRYGIRVNGEYIIATAGCYR